MLYTDSFYEEILLEPIRHGADKLCIVSGYATPTMASWHIKQISHLKLRGIDIELIVGMCPYDGISISAHKGFLSLIDAQNAEKNASKFKCSYVCEGGPVHSKLYIWLKNNTPVSAYIGSANYSYKAFLSRKQKEILNKCDPCEAYEYFNEIESCSIYCNHQEVEEYVQIHGDPLLLDFESSQAVDAQQSHKLSVENLPHVTLSWIQRGGVTGGKSGINWGQRSGRNPNEAYIPLPIDIARSGFFPLNEQHFTVMTDDGKTLILRVEQENDKAITTPLKNALLGEYIRGRIGMPNGSFVTREDFERYGRTDITFYKVDDETFYLDFSVDR